jgi:hypothetical protein
MKSFFLWRGFSRIFTDKEKKILDADYTDFADFADGVFRAELRSAKIAQSVLIRFYPRNPRQNLFF